MPLVTHPALHLWLPPEEIMRRLIITLAVGLWVSVAYAQREPITSPGELYALASASGGEDIPGGTPAGGFVVGGAWRPYPRVGLVADFGRHFASGAGFSANTFMAGPRLYSEEHYRMSGFVQILVGSQQTVLSGQPARWDYVLAPGAGADIRLSDMVVWRALQVDLTLTRAPGLPRVSSGFAFRFGR